MSIPPGDTKASALWLTPRTVVLGLIAAWTLIVAASAYSHWRYSERTAQELASEAARTAWSKDMLFRRWASKHGGVYVPVEAATPPNPYLADVPERDITTPSGRALTLMNPAYMTRQMYELTNREEGLQGHITSLKPIRPENAPDAWEAEALRAFERGEQEVSAVVNDRGRELLRLIRPLVTEASCVGCHASQGYRVGEVRGGISVTLPMAPFRQAQVRDRWQDTATHGGVWILGIAGLSLAGGLLERSSRRRLQAEAANEQLHQRLEGIMEAVGEGIYGLGLDGRVAFLNSTAGRLLGWDPAELLGQPAHILFHHTRPDGSPYPVEACPIYATARDGQTRQVRDELYWRRDRTSLPVDYVATALLEEGRHTGAVVAFRDMTESKQAEEGLRTRTEELDHFFTVALDLLCIADLEGHFRKLNKAWENTLGYRLDELEGRIFLDFVHPDDLKGTLEAIGTLAQGQNVINFINRYRCKDGSYLWIEWRSAPSADLIYASARDITERKRNEEALIQVCGDLETANRALAEKNAELDEFSYVASHDLQEPLRKLVSFSEMLPKDLQGDLSERAAKDLHFIVDAGRRMQTMIQDLLALSRAGRQAMRLEEIALEACLDEVLEILDLKLRESGARVEREPLPAVRGDRRMLTQLFQNLLGNALKFCRPGDVPRLSVTCRRDGGFWSLGVKDEGIGIEPRHFDQIFAPFKRLHGRTEFEGTGIGLAICKKAVERHGGRLWVEAEPGVGSWFRFTLPASEADTSGTGGPASDPGGNEDDR